MGAEKVLGSEGPLLTRQQAAEHLGIKAQTLAAWVTRGQGPAYIKVGRAVRYQRGALERWLESRTVGAGAGR